MTQQILENGKSWGLNRGQINANFTEVYSIKLEASQVLTKTNTTIFTPTQNYHPTTMLYVDELWTNWQSTYNPQSITGDVFLRSNHTGEIPPSTITQDSSNRFVTDAQVTSWDNKEDSIGAHETGFNLPLGTTANTVSEGNHSHTKADIGLGNADNTSDVNKPVSTLQQAALDLKADIATTYTRTVLDASLALKQDAADLEDDVDTLVKAGDIPFSSFLPTKAITADYAVDIATDYGLIVAATAADITITLPLLSSLAGKPYQILEIIPVVANGYKVRIAVQGSDTYPFGNTWFDLPYSQKHFAIGLHEHGFNLRRNITVNGTYHLDITPWGSANFATPTPIPWEHEEANTQTELIEWAIGDPGKIYVRTKGVYNISGGVNIEPQSVQAWEVSALIYVNGSSIPHMRMTEGGTGDNNASIYAATTIDLEEDDYIEMRLEHSGTAAVDITSAQFYLGIRL